ncbi:hypothetical protein ETD86_27245 [Nonomuraea turkmeniaca]|uniref:Streptomyces killer toxin-like beta/gamma crystallin domain-containing protein n=1 Tax=Nonomuraea turkmeniaca TaxID=103838 RepID=A0A5S4FBV0_9ACTN|nr:beta/gamma crystallin domain-containing protein [Nonomuraea turkmeniaca]TMR15474.1 hypothetical protein ETD86_27245 [Nonomuraea turkmeniaca]
MMSYLRKVLAGCAAALAVMVALPSPAFAINHVDCNRKDIREFLIIRNGLDRHCFANGGTMSVAIYGVDYISPGNNNVAIEYIDDLGGPSRALLIPKWTLWGFDTADGINGPMHMIYKIRII